MTGKVEVLTETVENCRGAHRLAKVLCTAQQVDAVRSLKVMVEEKAKQASLEENEAHFKAIKEFYRKASEGSAGVLHKLIKAKPMPAEEAPAGNGSLCDPVRASEEQRSSWGEIWLEKDPVQSSLRPWLEQGDTAETELLAPITAEEVCAGGMSFKVRTGLGVDNINPRVYGQATEGTREAIALVLNQAELTLDWPQQVKLLVYFMMVKPEGGLRGIA